MSLNRRTFLQGVLASVAGADALIRLATPAEASALIQSAPVLLGQPPRDALRTPFGEVGTFVFTQTERGRYVPIGILESIHHETDVVEMTVFDADVRQYAPGIRRAYATVLLTGVAYVPGVTDAS